jgi:hypothetical protein
MDLGGVLRLSLQANQEARAAGETLLKQANDSPGFATELARFALDGSNPHGERQLAAITLGRVIKTHWMQDENLAGPMVRSPGWERQSKVSHPTARAGARL